MQHNLSVGRRGKDCAFAFKSRTFLLGEWKIAVVADCDLTVLARSLETVEPQGWKLHRQSSNEHARSHLRHEVDRDVTD
jgi:hypothetical protein